MKKAILIVIAILVVIGAFLLLGGNGCVVWAEQFVPSGLTALLIGVGPLCLVLTEWAWPGGLRLTARTTAALLLPRCRQAAAAAAGKAARPAARPARYGAELCPLFCP